MLLDDSEESILVKTPLTGVELQKTLRGKANLKSVADIENYTSFAQVIGSYNHIILFIAIDSPSVGHWVAMFINSGNLFYCDSMGLEPLEILKVMTQRGLNTFGQTNKLLTLIRNSKYANRFYYNGKRYQQEKDSVQTCGRYAQTVVALNDIYTKEKRPFDLNVFESLMEYWKKKFHKSYDEIIVNF